MLEALSRLILLTLACLVLPQLGWATNLLSNSGFEEGTGNVATGWSENTWPSAEQRKLTHYERETSHIHGGASAQKVKVDRFVEGGGTLLYQGFSFPAGRIYEGRVWVRAESPMRVSMRFREAAANYTTSAARIVTVGSQWQELVIRGGFSSDIAGQFVISPIEGGTLVIDDAVLTDITEDVLRRPVFSATDEIPSRYFGIHINKLGTHHLWPPLNVGLLRLWDTGTTWAHVERQDGAIHEDKNWIVYPSPGYRLVKYLGHVVKKQPAAKVIYTLGITPLWAVDEVDVPDRYVGTAWPPDNLDQWRDYVGEVGKRFDGKIDYWEVWNEANYRGFYKGGLATLCELTRIASQELKAINPKNTILSPSFTTSGMVMMDDFLERGCGEYVDILSWHLYPSYPPERSLASIEAVMDVVRRHGLQHTKPVWNTEGAVEYGSADTAAVGPAAVARIYLIQWAYGIRQFSWYMWDDDPDEGRVVLHDSPDATKPKPPSPAGIAYREVANWLVGRKMISKLVEPSASGSDRWQLTISRGKYRGWTLWDTGGTSTFTVPEAWGATTIRTLDGKQRPLVGSTLQLGITPILLETDNYAPDPPDAGSASSGAGSLHARRRSAPRSHLARDVGSERNP